MMEKRNLLCPMLLSGKVKDRTGMCPLILAVWRILVALKKNSFIRVVDANR